MENEETTDELDVEEQDEQTEGVEETKSEEIIPEGKLTYEQKLAKATTPEEKFAIANAEAQKNRRLLTKKPKPATVQAPQTASPTNVEETVLLANGMDEELLEKLKKVAQVNGTTLIKAQNDPIFVAVKEKFEKEKKQAAASMPVSRGSGQAKPKKDFATPGLTRDEHKALFESTL